MNIAAIVMGVIVAAAAAFGWYMENGKKEDADGKTDQTTIEGHGEHKTD